MAKVDLNKNRESILQAHKEVFDTNNPINWALFSYEGQTSVLKLVSKGDGGLEEFMDDLNSGKMMYGYLCVQDPNSNLPKYVFVNWQGEGVPEMKKGGCANHVRDVAALLRGAHVSINARSEEDLDEETIMEKVSKASGSNYSVHKEKAMVVPEPTPVGSVYKRIKPQSEIHAQKRDAFWEKTELEERQRIAVDRQRSVEDRKKADTEVKEREAKDAQEREKRETERLKHIRQVKDAESKANTTKEADGASWEKQQEESMRDEQDRQRASERMRQERAKEAQSQIAGRKNNPRSMFQDKPQSQFDDQPTIPSSAPKGGPPPRKLRHDFLNRDDSASAVRKTPIQLPTEDPGNAAVLERPGEESTIQQDNYEEPAPRAEEYKTPTKPNRFAGSISVMPKKKKAAPEPELEAEPTSPVSPRATEEVPPTRNLLSDNLPKRQQDSDEEEDDKQDWDEPSSQPTQEHFSPAPVAPVPSDDVHGQCARALYDYQAAEDNEITFDPDDVITNIEQIDDGWWVGIAPDGTRGMFPSNYVELV